MELNELFYFLNNFLTRRHVLGKKKDLWKGAVIKLHLKKNKPEQKEEFVLVISVEIEQLK